MKSNKVITFLDSNIRKDYKESDDAWLDLLDRNDPLYKDYATSLFDTHADGLFLDNTMEIDKIFFCIFPTKKIIQEVGKFKNTLLISHHLLDYDELSGTFQGFGKEGFENMRENNNSFYFLHISLDRDLVFSPSFCLAEKLKLNNLQPVSAESFGGELMYGEIKRSTFLSNIKMFSPLKTLSFSHDKSRDDDIVRVCVGAGAGEMAFILSEIKALGIDYYVTGDIFRYGTEYLDKTFPKYLFEAFKNQISLVGLSHYFSESFWMRKIADYLSSELKLPVEILRDEEREFNLRTRFSSEISISGNI